MKKLFLRGTGLFLILFAATFFYGCSPANTEPELKPADFFPLGQGSTWEYLGEGNEFASFKREVVFTKGNKAQIREDNGGTVSAAVFEISDQAITRVYFQGESYEDKNFIDEEPNDSTVILKSPLESGTKWEEEAGETREIVETDAVAETPAGTFEKCIKVKISYPDSTLYEYFKEGTGMVKREFVSGETRVSSALEKYDIKK